MFEPRAAGMGSSAAATDMELDAPAAAGFDAPAPRTEAARIARTLFKVLCWFLFVAAMVYLGVAGVNYALISGVQIPEELHGTKILLAYSAVQAVLFFAAGVLGLVGRSRMDAKRYMCLAPWAPAALVVVAEATHMFNMGDHALNNSFIFGANFFFGALAVLAGILAAVTLHSAKDQDGTQLAAAVVSFDTDPVVAAEFSSPANASDGATDDADGAAGDDDAGDAADGDDASDEAAAGDDVDDAVDNGAAREDGEAAREAAFEVDEEGGADAEHDRADAADAEDAADAADVVDEDDEEEVERPHGAHF